MERFMVTAVGSEPGDFQLNARIKHVVRCSTFCQQLRQGAIFQCDDRANLQNLMQSPRQRVFSFGDRHQEVGAQRRPDLAAYPVRIGAEETAQPQVLLYPE